MIAQAEQAVAQRAQLLSEGGAPRGLGGRGQVGLEGVAQIHQQLQQSLALLQPCPRRPEQPQAEQGHDDAEGCPEQAQRDPAVELLFMQQPAHDHHETADGVANGEPNAAGNEPSHEQGQWQGHQHGEVAPGAVAKEHHHRSDGGADQPLTTQFQGVAVVAHGHTEHGQGGIHGEGQPGEGGEAIHHGHRDGQAQVVAEGWAHQWR